MSLTAVELCAGGGGQALGLELAGFEHVALVERDLHSCATLRQNREAWNIIHDDIRAFNARNYRGVDLLAAGLPCPPFSRAGLQLGKDDERNLFPEALRIISEIRPKAVLIENVRGLLDPVFEDFRADFADSLAQLGYKVSWKLVDAADFGVPQIRRRVLIVALQSEFVPHFRWPEAPNNERMTVGEAIHDLISAAGWPRSSDWKKLANIAAPTLVGGSTKHGGPDLGPTRAKLAWHAIGIDASQIASDPPTADFTGLPRLTLRMAARLQGFPDNWSFCGGKTAAYRQIGNAFPPPVAQAIAVKLSSAVRRLRAPDLRLGQLVIASC